MEVVTLKGQPRAEVGTRAARALRDAGQMPAVIYGHGQDAEAVSLALHDVKVALARGARTLHVELGGTSRQYLIKEVQYDHLGDSPIHLDLTRVAMDERVTVRIGIEPRGVPRGVSEGGVLDRPMVDIEVECLVTAIPETLRPLVTELGLGDSLLVKDLELPPGVSTLSDPEDRVFTVRALVEEPEVEEVADEDAAAQPERIGRVREEDGEGASGGN